MSTTAQAIEPGVLTPTDRYGAHELKSAFQALSELINNHAFEFIGNIEPSKIFENHVDVVVTSGFAGNELGNPNYSGEHAE